ncbi:LysR substrate-binding domain-containing protein [Methylobacterium terricola]|nr:LysR substrate-binding domain-containing protein [Methylobacterium terricola]
MRDVVPDPARLPAPPSSGGGDGQRRPGARLPPLNLFRAFDAAVRQGSFRLAADEMCVTPSAVSQQIRQLEDLLDTRLFRRLTRRIELTREGEALASTVKDALAILSAGCERLRDPSVPAIVCLNITPTLGMRWMVARMTRFMQDHPGIRISLTASLDALDFERQDVDLGIRWGTGAFPGARAELLARDVLFPVCNPDFIDHTTIRHPADLRHHVLLQAVHNGVTWATWLDRVRATGDVPLSGTVCFNDANMMLEAVVCGQGIGLSNSFLAEADLRSGRLVRLFDYDIEIDDAYYILSSGTRGDKPAVAQVRDWLHREAQRSAEIVHGRASLAETLAAQ